VEAAWSRADVKPVASCYCHPDARGVQAKECPCEMSVR
jgi:hypothetical protein